MKIHEKARYYEDLARKRERIISALVPLLQVEWAPETRNDEAGALFWTQHAFITEGRHQEMLIAFHVRYSKAQPSLGNKRDRYSVLTCDEVKRQPASYVSAAVLKRLQSLERRAERPET